MSDALAVGIDRSRRGLPPPELLIKGKEGSETFLEAGNNTYEKYSEMMGERLILEVYRGVRAL